MKLTVYFEQAFWYSLVEYTDNYGQYRVLRYLFGSEPKDVDIFHLSIKKCPPSSRRTIVEWAKVQL